MFQVLVKSIIEQDPLRPIDESELVWSDEEEDEKVYNLIFLINTNYCFTNSNFKGGLTRLDVDRMRTSETGSSKLKKPKKHHGFISANDQVTLLQLLLRKLNLSFKQWKGISWKSARGLIVLKVLYFALFSLCSRSLKRKCCSLLKNWLLSCQKATKPGHLVYQKRKQS